MVTNQSSYENAVFVSYAWGGESELIVGELEQAFIERGIHMVRDKKELGYKGSIEAFERRIGQGQCIILVISDKYLRSEHCMYELMEADKNRNLHDRIFPIVLAEAQIYKAIDRLNYIKHWEKQIEQLNQAIKEVDVITNLSGFTADLNKYAEIRASFDHLTDLLSDMNAQTPEILAANGFSTLINAVEHAISKNKTPLAWSDSISTVDKISEDEPEQYDNPKEYIPLTTRLTKKVDKPISQGKKAGQKKIAIVGTAIMLSVAILAIFFSGLQQKASTTPSLGIWESTNIVALADFKQCPGGVNSLKEGLDTFLKKVAKITWVDLGRSFTDKKQADAAGVEKTATIVLWEKCAGDPLQPIYVLDWLGPEDYLAEPASLELTKWAGDDESFTKTLAALIAYYAYAPVQAQVWLTETESIWSQTLKSPSQRARLYWLYGNAKYRDSTSYNEISLFDSTRKPYEIALDLAQQANTLADIPQLNNNIGLTFHQQFEYSIATEKFSLSLRDDPQYFWAYVNRGVARMGSSTDHQLAHADCAEAVTQNFAPGYLCHALIYWEDNDYDKVLDASEAALRFYPDDATYYTKKAAFYAEAYYRAGQSAVCMQDFEKAIKYLREGMKWSRSPQMTEKIEEQLDSAQDQRSDCPVDHQN